MNTSSRCAGKFCVGADIPLKYRCCHGPCAAAKFAPDTQAACRKLQLQNPEIPPPRKCGSCGTECRHVAATAVPEKICGKRPRRSGPHLQPRAKLPTAALIRKQASQSEQGCPAELFRPCANRKH